MKNDFLIANGPHEDPEIFRARFWRSHGLLQLVACRVLGNSERADEAIENCWLTASRNPPRFEYEGAFRSWVVRVLIDRALVLLRDNEESDQSESACTGLSTEHEINCTKTEIGGDCRKNLAHAGRSP